MRSSDSSLAGRPGANLQKLRDQEQRLRKQNAALLELTLFHRDPTTSRDDVVRRATETAVRILPVARASVWLFAESSTRLRCVDIYDGASCEHSSGGDLRVEDYPVYFSTLLQRGTIVVDDTSADPVTAELRKPYLEQLGITSMLDSAIAGGSKSYGVVCLEHVGPMRRWTELEKSFAATVAELLSASLSTFERQRTELYLKTLLDSAGQGVITVGPTGRVLHMNPTADKLFGYEPDEFLGESVDELLGGGLGADLWQEDSTAEGVHLPPKTESLPSRDGTPLSARRKDGSTFPAIIAHCHAAHEGERIAFVLVTDVTNRMRVEQELRESQALYRAIIEDQTDIVIRTGPGGRVLFANEPVAVVLERSLDEIIGHHVHEFVPVEDRAIILENAARISPENPVVHYEHRIVKSGGVFATLALTLRGIYDGDGQLEGFQAIGRDVSTERSQEQRMRQAQRLESLAVLAGGIAHDFNNLLTPIMGYTEQVYETFETGSHERQCLDEVLTAANHARDLVRQILLFSCNDDTGETVPVHAARVVKDTVEFLRSSLPPSIEFDSKVDGECGIVEARPSDLYQILSNLATNAYQAMPTGGRLEISAGVVPLEDERVPAGTYLELIVRDDGTGIAEDVQERMFEPFFTTKGLGEGTGLGLSVVHGTVSRLGGFVDARSQPGEGACFSVYLPCAVHGSGSGQEAHADPAENPRGDEHVLIVDDEAIIAELLGEMLQGLGYSVTGCTGASEALAAFEANPEGIDLVLADFAMPQMTGTQLVCKMRRLRADLPIVLATGFWESIDPEELQRIGVGRLLKKPFTRADVARAVRDVLDARAVDG